MIFGMRDAMRMYRMRLWKPRTIAQFRIERAIIAHLLNSKVSVIVADNLQSAERRGKVRYVSGSRCKAQDSW